MSHRWNDKCRSSFRFRDNGFAGNPRERVNSPFNALNLHLEDRGT
jgi:hypothetical protein